MRSGDCGHRGDEQIGDGGSAEFTERGKTGAIDTIEEKNGAAKYLAFVERAEGARRSELFGAHHQFGVAGFEIFHAGSQHDAAATE